MALSIAPDVSIERLTEWVQRFIRYPSQQTERMEADPAVTGFIAECVSPLMAELGLDARIDPKGNLIVELGPKDAGKSLMFMTYAMTHPKSSMRDPFAGEIVACEGGPAIRGRGVSEQKAGMAAALAAVYAYHARGGRGALTFVVSTAGETGRHDAAEAILAGLGRRPALGVIVIGTSSRVALGNKGRIDIAITVRGKASHSSMPGRGINAIAGAHKVLERLAAFDLGRDRHPGLGRATLTATSIESFPKATHTVQNEVRMMYDLRLLPGHDPDDRLASVSAALAGIGGPWTVEVAKGPFMYPCEVGEDCELVRHILAGYRDAGLPAPGFMWSQGALDAGYLAQLGAQATMWGPGSVEMWHSDDESVPVEEVWNGANAYLGLIRSYLG